MLETELKKLTAAVEANTAALLNTSAPVSATPETPKPSPEPAAPVAETPVANVDKKTLIAKIIELATKKSRAHAATILAEYGVAKASELKDASKYGEIVAKIDALLAS